MTTPTARPDTNEDFDYIAFALKRMWGERDEASAKFPSSIEAWAQYDRLCASLAKVEAKIEWLEAEIAETIASSDRVCDSYAKENQRFFDRIERLEAQIAEKDAALRLAFSRLDPMAEADETIAFIEAALSGGQAT